MGLTSSDLDTERQAAESAYRCLKPVTKSCLMMPVLPVLTQISFYVFMWFRVLVDDSLIDGSVRRFLTVSFYDR